MTTERESAIPITELDKATQARLTALMGTDPAALTAADTAFLVARKDYLTAAQRKDYGIGKEQGKTEAEKEAEKAAAKAAKAKVKPKAKAGGKK